MRCRMRHRIVSGIASGNLIWHAGTKMAHCVEKGCFGGPFAFLVARQPFSPTTRRVAHDSACASLTLLLITGS